MPTWAYVLLAIVAVLVAGMFRERWRIGAVERWCQPRGFRVLSPFTPSDRPPMAALAARFALHGGRLWGLGVQGALDGIEVTIAEHETSQAARATGKWHTLVVWPRPGTSPPLLVWRAPAAALATTAGVEVRLGRERADPSVLRAAAGASLIIEGDPAARAAFLTPARLQALEAWPHGGAFAVQEGHAAWRIEGTLTAATLEHLADRLRLARTVLAD
jgi:hypothetical protein